MNIYAEKGTIVRVTEDSLRNGYPIHEEKARKYLKVGVDYTVEKTVVSEWHTDVYLKEFPSVAFNSANFE